MRRILLPKIQKPLLDWFAKNQRPLPWRKTYNSYEVWISEIMLQQTQVNTILPYFKRWMKALPSIKAVAEAKEDTILKLWEGLGYYSRVKNIQKAAQILMKENGGQMFNDFEKILKLPGIGKYTAGAICSIAFNQNYPVVDGNVIRVLSRLTNFQENTTQNRDYFWKLSQSLLSLGEARSVNQALMEFGALQCIPKNPFCPSCPLQLSCKAFACGTQKEIPRKSPPVAKVPIQVALAVIQKKGKLFIQKRPDKGLMAGLWEFPGGRVEKGENLEDALKREIQEELGISVKNIKAFMNIKHSYTKYLVDLHCFLADYHAGRVQLSAASQSQWIRPEKLTQFAFPAANVKLIKKLLSKKIIRFARPAPKA